LLSGPPNSWDTYVERLNQQLPDAPPGLLDVYVKWAPWLAIVFGALSLLLLLGALLLGAVIAPFLVLGGMKGIGAGFSGLVALLLGIVASAADVWGGSLMLQMKLTGWWLIALALVVSLLSGVLSISIFGLLLTIVIGYIHIKVKPRYT
jgi:hypothetical protein